MQARKQESDNAKRSHQAHPGSFIGCPRGRSANWDCSLKLTQLSASWDMPPEKRSYSRKFRYLYLSLRLCWRKCLNSGRIYYVDHRIKKFPDGSCKTCSNRKCFTHGVPRWGMFHVTPNCPSVEDDDPDNPLFVLSAPNGLPQPLRSQ